MFKHFWLALSQVITGFIMLIFIFLALKPQWLPNFIAQRLYRSPPVPSLDSNASLKPTVAPKNLEGLSYHEAVAAAVPSVVKINTSRNKQEAAFSDPILNQLFTQSQIQEQSQLGSGVIIDSQGYIVTNYHVVQNAEVIQVILNDGSKSIAAMVGIDPESDIAVLKIKGNNLPNITFGYDKDLRVGDVVLAIGNPFGVGQSVSMGIVSALHRNQINLSTFEDYIQTDASINHGNSGGALVDSNGHLVGINAAMYSAANSEVSAGVGFAIPASTVREIAQSIIKTGEYSRGYIGVTSQNVTPQMAQAFSLPSSEGVIIATVTPGGPADRAGMMIGDIITQLNKIPLRDKIQMSSDVALLKPGVTTQIKILRQGQTLEIPITIGKRPNPTIK